MQYPTHFWNLCTNELTHNWADISAQLLSAIQLVCSLNFHDAPVKHLVGDHYVTMVTSGSQVTEVRAK